MDSNSQFSSENKSRVTRLNKCSLPVSQKKNRENVKLERLTNDLSFMTNTFAFFRNDAKH